MAAIKVTVKEVSLIKTGEMMAWVLKNCLSYSHAEAYVKSTPGPTFDLTDSKNHYYALYFNDPQDATLFTLKWL
jgi:hypothetical protein